MSKIARTRKKIHFGGWDTLKMKIALEACGGEFDSELTSCTSRLEMEARADAFIEDLLFDQASNEDCDEGKAQVEHDFQLPPWFDQEKFKRGQEHFKNNKFVLVECMIAGVICSFAVPNIASVMASTHRANTPVTSYRRYISSVLHTFSWLEKPLAPGSEVWKSLKTIRLRHFRAARIARALAYGRVGQRDIALMQAGFVAYGVLRAKQFGLLEERPGDEEAFMHVWRVIGHMLGLKERYNICRPDPEETKAVCRKIVNVAYMPNLIEPPEYALHIISSLINALRIVFPHLSVDMFLYFTKWLAGVPGYEYLDSDLVLMRNLLKDHTTRGTGTGCTDGKLSSVRKFQTLSNDPLDALKIEDYGSLATIPAYRKLTAFEKWMLGLTGFLHRSVNTTYLGRVFLNKFTNFNLFLVEYFPIYAIYKFGIKMAYIDRFAESIKDETLPRTNEEVLKERNKTK